MVGVGRYDHCSDAELLVRSRGEPEAFAALYERHAEPLLRYFVHRTLDPGTSAELVAETFAEALASRGRFRDRGAPGAAWLYAIARRRLARYARRGVVDDRARRRLGLPDRGLAPDDYERIEELIDLQPLRSALREALAELPEEQREAIRLRVLEGLAYAEVARRQACTEATARARVSRGLRRLGERLRLPADPMEA
jgi:RNA polymerase sigma-70 factor (ECF subfamily)